MRAELLVFMVVLFHDGGRCLGYVVEDPLRMQDPIVPSNNVNKLDGKLYHVKHEDDSLTPNADQAKHIVNNFLQKLKRYENVESAPKADKCGYEVCNVGIPGMLNVHLVPHTHDDVGWLRTVDEYFYGSGITGVQYILDTVSDELLNDPQKRFVYVELAFFTRWWNELHDSTRHLIKGLVSAGRLEFILGGWCMNDEASTHYSSIIDQHTIGFRFLNHSFGECGRPRVGWQIDPFGHSRETASIFAQFGFDAVFFARMDYQDYNKRSKEKNLEHVWMGSGSLGDQATLFTGGLSGTTYSAPAGFCFQCGDEPIMDDPRLEDYNVDRRVNDFVNVVENQAKSFATNHIMLTMGNDFQYENARINFKNMDKLIKYVNRRQSNGSKINAFYSTPSCYAYAMNQLNHTYTRKDDDYFPYAYRSHSFMTGYFTSRPALKGYERTSNNFLQQSNGSKINALYSTPSCYVYAMNQLNQTYKRKDDDYFPYAHRSHSFWTGYFTSRPTLKGYERTSNNFLQVCKQLETLSVLGPEHGSILKVDSLRQALGVLQHHDGVSGTSKQHVADDYAKMVAKGVAACQEVVNASYGKILPQSSSAPHLSIQFCPLANVSNCPASETSKEFVVLIYNPVARAVDYTARIPVSGSAYTVKDAQQKPVDVQVVPLSVSTYHIPDFKGSKATGELVFIAKLPPLGLTTYFVKASSDDRNSLSLVGRVTGSDVVIKNEFLSLTFSGTTGLLKGLTNTEKSLSVELSNELLYYKSHVGNNQGGENQASGAYIFRPDGNDPHQIATGGSVATNVVQGSEVQEVRQVFSQWASQVVRLYKGQRYAEIEWTVGPIPIQDKDGKEVISLFSSSLNSNKTFYTDANGREILKRVRDYRPTWDLEQTEPVAGNYYPVNSRIFIQDAAKNLQLTVLTDRSQGGSSIKDGQLELMLHRRVLHDDSLGVSEPLNEPGLDGKGLVVRGKYYIILDTIEGSVHQHRDLAQRLYMAPSVSFIQTDLTPDVYSKNYKTTWSGLKNSLPDNVHLLTLEQWHSGRFLLRLEHFYEKNEDKELSKVAEVSLKNLFAPFTVVSVEEHTLGANQPLSKATRLQWNVQDYGRTTRDMSSFVKPVDPQTLIVELKPMQIRTFHVIVNE